MAARRRTRLDRPDEPLGVTDRLTLDDIDRALRFDAVAVRGSADLADANVDLQRFGDDTRFAQLADAIGPTDDHPDQHTRVGTARAVDGVESEIRIGEQRIDRRREELPACILLSGEVE